MFVHMTATDDNTEDEIRNGRVLQRRVENGDEEAVGDRVEERKADLPLGASTSWREGAKNSEISAHLLRGSSSGWPSVG